MNLKNPELVYMRSFEMNRQQNYKGHVLMLWMNGILVYVNCLSLEETWASPQQDLESHRQYVAYHQKIRKKLQCCVWQLNAKGLLVDIWSIYLWAKRINIVTIGQMLRRPSSIGSWMARLPEWFGKCLVRC